MAVCACGAWVLSGLYYGSKNIVVSLSLLSDALEKRHMSDFQKIKIERKSAWEFLQRI